MFGSEKAKKKHTHGVGMWAHMTECGKVVKKSRAYDGVMVDQTTNVPTETVLRSLLDHLKLTVQVERNVIVTRTLNDDDIEEEVLSYRYDDPVLVKKPKVEEPVPWTS